jgi:hypothetical protein
MTAAKSNSRLKQVIEESPELGPFVEKTIKPFRARSTVRYGGDLPINLGVFKGFFT